MKCPHCFRPLPEEIEWLSCSGPCQPETLAELTEMNGGVDIETKRAFGVELEQCPRCQTPSSVEACPACHWPVPDEWRRTPSPRITCVAMVGARSSGKSLYLAVLKSQLEIFVMERHKSVLDSLGDTEQRFNDRFGQHVFENQRILESTREGKQDPQASWPLVFKFQDTRKQPHILVLRDIAGEDLEELPARKDQLAFLTRADAIVALIDPMKIDPIARVLQGRVRSRELGGSAFDILRNLLDFLRENEDRQQASTRLAVAISQFDLVQELADAEGDLSWLMRRPGSPLMRDPSMKSPSFDEQDADLLQLEVESLLKKLEDSSLDNLLRERSSDFRYFAVSSLGAEPEGEAINKIGIAPFRVLDPIKWVMKL